MPSTNVFKRREAVAKYAAKMRIYIDTFKNVPCMDCGIQYPTYVMDFDHRENKNRGVGDMTTYSKQRIKEEIDKCDIVCSNCHRERTYQKLWASNSMVRMGNS